MPDNNVVIFIKINMKSILLSRGYFPKELPKIFSTKHFASCMESKQVDNNEKPFSRCLKTTIPKAGDFRRNISIPNPKHYYLLTKAISDNWDKMKGFLDASEISMSQVKIDSRNVRAITHTNSYDEVIQKKLSLGFSSRYLLSTDISKFYQTIYTHSIPWALHGKAISKKNTSDSLYGNLIDKLVRNTQDRQTLGIAIGPDTSRIISEIIGTHFDLELKSNHHQIKAIRYIDDFFIFTDSRLEAEQILNNISHYLNDFELTINEEKTKIEKLPVVLESNWIQELKRFRIRSKQEEQKNDLIHLFNISINLLSKYPKENVFHFMITKIIPIKIYKDNWHIFESILLQVVLAEPKTITLISKIFVSYSTYLYPIDKNRISETLLKLIYQGIASNLGFEISWALWTLLQLGIEVKNQIPNIENITDPTARLLVLYCMEKEIYQHSFNRSSWQSLITTDDLYKENWLFTYESFKRGWLKNKEGKDILSTDSFFQILESSEVTFLDTEFKTTPIKIDELSSEENLNEDSDIFNLIYGDEEMKEFEDDEKGEDNDELNDEGIFEDTLPF